MGYLTSLLLAVFYGRVGVYFIECLFPLFQKPGNTTSIFGWTILFIGFFLGFHWGKENITSKGLSVFLDASFIAIGFTLSSNPRFSGINGDTLTLALGAYVGTLCTYILFRDGYFGEKCVTREIQPFFIHRQ